MRAILGQQVSVNAARNLVALLVQKLGYQGCYFPLPDALLQSDLAFLTIPAARRATLHNFAKHFNTSDQALSPETWLSLKGIGRWTVDYARLRGLGEPDIFLAGDLGVQKSPRGPSDRPDASLPLAKLFNPAIVELSLMYCDYLPSPLGDIQVLASSSRL